jgi:hypothetical protein
MTYPLSIRDFNKVELVSIITQCEIEKSENISLTIDKLIAIKEAAYNSQLMSLSIEELGTIVNYISPRSLGWYAYFKEI